MRAIIIDDKDARELVERLELVRFKELHPLTGKQSSVDEIHRAFHFEVVRWLQDQGASTIRSG